MELGNFSIGLPHTIFILGTILAVHWTIRQMKKKPKLNTIPGPKAIPWLGNSMDLIKSEGKHSRNEIMTIF